MLGFFDNGFDCSSSVVSGFFRLIKCEMSVGFGFDDSAAVDVDAEAEELD